MQRLEVSDAVRPLQWSLGDKGLMVYVEMTGSFRALMSPCHRLHHLRAGEFVFMLNNCLVEPKCGHLQAVRYFTGFSANINIYSCFWRSRSQS